MSDLNIHRAGDVLPTALLERLRAQGVDPATLDPGQSPVGAGESPEDAAARLARQAANKRSRWERRLPVIYRDATLGALAPDQHGAEIAAWWESVPQRRTLFLAGPMGTGKTYAAYALGRMVVERGWWVEAWSTPELLDALRPGPEADATFGWVSGCDLLILDDLLAAKASSWAVEQMFRLADTRVAGAKAQVLTTNGSFEDLVETWGGPTMDRWSFKSAAVKFDGPSRRRGGF